MKAYETIGVLNSTTCEVEYFTLSRASLYKLAKNYKQYSLLSSWAINDLTTRALALDPNVENLEKNIVFSIFSELISNYDLYGFLRAKDYIALKYGCKELYTYPELKLTTHKFLYGHLYSNDSLINVNGQHIQRYINRIDIKKLLRKCSDCGEIYIDIKEADDLCLSHYLDGMRIYGINGECKNCQSDYAVCPDCERIIYDDDGVYVDNRCETVCQKCYENGDFQTCERCGAVIDRDYNSDGIWTNDDNFYCCEECANSEGYYWDDYYEDYRPEEEMHENENRCVGDYHSHYYEKVGKRKPNEKHDLLSGAELEVDSTSVSRSDFDSDFYDGLSDILDNGVFFERDGSLDNGFECITQPHYVDDMVNLDWEQFLEKLSKAGWKSHDTNTCGLHFHFSKWFLGYNTLQIRNNAKKVAAFFENNWDDLLKFSRRKDTHYCNKFGKEITKDTSFSDLSYDRYHAVNLTNLGRSSKDTIEIRLCRGTLVPSTFRASFDLMLNIVRNAKRISWKNINNLSLWLKGIKPETKEYMASRNCFADYVAQ